MCGERKKKETICCFQRSVTEHLYTATIDISRAVSTCTYFISSPKITLSMLKLCFKPQTPPPHPPKKINSKIKKNKKIKNTCGDDQVATHPS